MPIDVPKDIEATSSSDESKVDRVSLIFETAKETFISFRDGIIDRFSKFSERWSHDDDSSSDKKIIDLIPEEIWEDDYSKDVVKDVERDIEEDYWEDDSDSGSPKKEPEEDYWEDESDSEPTKKKLKDEVIIDIWSDDDDPDDAGSTEGGLEDDSFKDFTWGDEESDDDEKIGADSEETENLAYKLRLETLGFPKSVEDIKTDRYLGGSSGVTAGFVNGDPESSEMFVVKKARIIDGTYESLNTGQLVEGHIADRIYEALGFNVSPSVIYDNGSSRVAKFIPGKDLCSIDDSHDYEKVADEVRKGFVLDCFLGNWDVIGGLGGDNIRVGIDGKVYRIDNDGSLNYRARGEKKTNFGREVTELETMREKNSIFSTITDSEISDQIDYLLDNQYKILNTLDEVLGELDTNSFDYWGLRNVLLERLEYLSEFQTLPDKKKYRESLEVYIEKFDNNESIIEGIPVETRNAIRKNVENSVEDNWTMYVREAKNINLSTIDFLVELQTKLEKLTESSHIFRATDIRILGHVLRDGRFKSQFETNTSGGYLNPGYRAGAEESMFGYAEDLPPEKRPIYCYCSDAEHGEINQDGKNPPYNYTRQYGLLAVKMKDEVKRRATFTNQDSLRDMQKTPPTPFLCPHLASVKVSWYFNLDKLNSTSVVEEYNEVQIHGGLRAEDIETIYISRDNGASEEDIKFAEEMVEEYNERNPKNKIILEEY